MFFFFFFFFFFYADLPATVWIVGDSHIHWAGEQALQRVDGPQLGLEHRYDIIWRGKRGARLEVPHTNCMIFFVVLSMAHLS